jgi:Ca2+-binding RTX toxin-like protein
VAFETIRGESGVDFVGTAAVDALFSLNETGLITAEGKEGNDTIDIANSTGVVGTTTVKGGDGNDTIGFAGAGGSNESRLTNSQINGSKGDDTITTVGAESSKIKGNADDDNLVLSGNYSNTTINGGAGEDSFSLSLDTLFPIPKSLVAPMPTA